MELKSEIDEVIRLYNKGHAANFAIALVKGRRKENVEKNLDKRRREIFRK
ncbi:hypothetical protein [Clostridium botulinum]|nr:hypothetical protein [Clostridium botulinum]MCD3202861.1 hypothetical protein [Clostridium botulinum C/D]MCD3230852.1 hypothetical protein [Clostridium botulinum C/D]MCD3253963.1 hypothetical protein [Clostridium botulinum C/D]MCD3279441.1 hypothetical protein [Clostridium botulinum C/D]MCD3282788.1 hypothetical protein [Clostridium botulinum C/D]